MNISLSPADIAVNLKQKEVKITWQDGYESSYTLDQLRRNCPCATCNEIRNQANTDPLRVLTADQVTANSELESENPVQVVGNYALQFFWADGHRSGIYAYQYLRSLSTKSNSK